MKHFDEEYQEQQKFEEMSQLSDSRLYCDLNLGWHQESQSYLIQLCHSGDIYIKGKLCINDLEVYEAARLFFLGI